VNDGTGAVDRATQRVMKRRRLFITAGDGNYSAVDSAKVSVLIIKRGHCTVFVIRVRSIPEMTAIFVAADIFPSAGIIAAL
jgi:hypothetical protein